MTASFLASFAIYLITGVVAFSRASTSMDWRIKVSVSGVLLLTAIFYYYLAAYAEMSAESKTVLASQKRLEWFVRVLSQSLLFSLWFMLESSWVIFEWGLVAVYAVCVVWDI